MKFSDQEDKKLDVCEGKREETRFSKEREDRPVRYLSS